MGNAYGEQGALQALLRSMRAVFFSFDGPVADLFRGRSTAHVADSMKYAAREVWGTLDPDVEDCDDFHGLLQRIRDMFDRPSPAPRNRRPLELAEAIATRYESDAGRSASLAPHFVELADVLLDLDMRLAIVSNVSVGPIWTFLTGHALQSKIEIVVGRDPHEPRHMKPDPYTVDAAVRHMGLAPSLCLLVGDQLMDLESARSAGTQFLGYTQSRERAAELWRRGSDWVETSHQPLISAAVMLRKIN